MMGSSLVSGYECSSFILMLSVLELPDLFSLICSNVIESGNVVLKMWLK